MTVFFFVQVYYDVSDTYSFPPTFLQIERTEDYFSDMGLSPEAIAYIQSWKTFDVNNYLNYSLYRSGKESFEQFARSLDLKNVSDFKISTANRYDNSTEVFCYRCKNRNINLNDGLLVNGRLTYEINFDPYSRNRVELSEYGLLIRGSSTKQNYYLNLGKGRHLMNVDEDIELNLYSKYEIRVNAHRMIRFERNFETCTKVERESLTSCAKRCKYSIYETCGHCRYVLSGNESLLQEDRKLCSLLVYDIFGRCHGENTRNISQCSKHCLPLCEEIVYQFTMQKLHGYNEINVLFLLNYVDDGILTYEEKPSFSFHTAVSNVGGQLGLWLGMSLITLVQFCMYCITRLLEKKTRTLSRRRRCFRNVQAVEIV